MVALMLLATGCKKKPTGTAIPQYEPTGTETPLHEAAKRGDIEDCQSLIAAGVAVDATDQYGFSALHYAAEHGYKEVAELLVAKGANVNTRTERGWSRRTPLHYAAFEGHKDLVEWLISNGADINARCAFHRTPLHAAAEHGHRQVVELLIAKGGEVNAKDLNHDAPLHAAAETGHRVVVQLLISQGADVNAKALDGGTPLHRAAAQGHRGVAELLIAKGADVNAKTEARWKRNALSALHCAVSAHHSDVVELLVAKGADIRVTSKDLELLHFAARYGLQDLAVLLLADEPDVNAKNWIGNIALHEAAREGQTNLAKLLLAHGGDVNAKNWGGTRPLHYAASYGHTDLAKLLLANGADVNAKDKDGDTPLHSAALRGRKKVAELLLAYGADVKAKDGDGRTPADEAARRGERDIVELLAAKATDVCAKTPEERTAASQAVPARPADVVQAATTTAPDPDLEHLRVQRVPLPPSAIARQNVKTVVQDNSAFAFDLYQQLRSSKGNLFFSPYSISTALAMTYAGARGNTEKQMAETLHFSLPQKNLHPTFAELQGGLKKLQEAGNVKLCIANSLWPQRSHPFLDECLSLAKKYYGVSITPVDYINAREAARRTINTWVEKKTEDKIKDLIQSYHLNEITRLVLVNAIYFRGNWEYPFDPRETKDAPFYVTPKKPVQIPMMRQTERVRYAEVKSLHILELPYRGEDLSMLVLLPREIDGLEQLEDSLSTENLEFWRQRLEARGLIIFLPKFQMTSSFDLKETLKAMGMVDPFTFPGANFAGFDGDPRWFFIGEVVHKAFVDVNEEGTEAAAATAVVMGYGGVPAPPPTFRADRPFLFLIQENRTGSILFIGRVTDPTKSS
jgi:serine protease inhibitor/ankyrin repeat protein